MEGESGFGADFWLLLREEGLLSTGSQGVLVPTLFPILLELTFTPTGVNTRNKAFQAFFVYVCVFVCTFCMFMAPFYTCVCPYMGNLRYQHVSILHCFNVCVCVYM